MNHFTMKPTGLMEIWRNNPQNLPRGHTSMKERDIISMATELCILDMVKKCINTKINVSLTWKVEKTMATLSRTLAWKLPWTEEPGGLQSMGGEESDTTEQLHFHFSLSCTGEGNGSPLQCSRLESPRDGGAWWAAVYGVAQRRTRLKRLSSSGSVLKKTWDVLPGWVSASGGLSSVRRSTV